MIPTRAQETCNCECEPRLVDSGLSVIAGIIPEVSRNATVAAVDRASRPASQSSRSPGV